MPTRVYKRSRSKGSRALPRVLRKAIASANRQRVPRNFSTFEDPFPTTKYAVMKYADTYYLGNGAFGLFGTEQAFRLGSLYDFYLTGGGHQPYGFDQMSAMYAQYQVMSVDVEVTFVSPSTNMLCGAVMISTSADLTNNLAVSNFGKVAERPNAEVRYLNSAAPSTIKKSWNLWEVAGRTKAGYMGDPSWNAAWDGNPNGSIYLRTAVCDLTSNFGAAAQSCGIMVEVTFHARFFSRVTVGQS